MCFRDTESVGNKNTGKLRKNQRGEEKRTEKAVGKERNKGMNMQGVVGKGKVYWSDEDKENEE